MMLRKRSRAVGSKPGLMADSQPLSSPTETKHNMLAAVSLFPSPRLLSGMSPKSFSDYEAAMSPTSTLETKHLSNSISGNFFSDVHLKKTPLASGVAESKLSKTVSLGILDALNDESTEKQSDKRDSRMVLFASQLKIQIPSVNPRSAPLEIPSSPIEFGIKNKDSQLALFSPAQRTLSAELPVLSPRVVTASIPVSEMELSEDYTRVICHGPNPRTTHIFDNCVVESCGDGFTASKKDGNFVADCNCFPFGNSFNCCDAGKKNTGEANDIKFFGERSFGSECHFQVIFPNEN